jgi:divalent metal cation (Fe/Co/Zn/Cd) transporter
VSWTDWTCLGAFIIGFLLFVIGANISLWGGTSAQPFQYETIGFTGLYLSIGAIAAYIIIYVYKELTKKLPLQNP